MGDTRTSSNGYQYTRTATGWKLSHRLVVERELGIEIRPNERVRFVDGDRTNLSPKNLVVYEVKIKTNNRKVAELEAKRDDLDAEIAELRELDPSAEA